MADALRYYIAHNGGLKIMQPQGGSMNTFGEFFEVLRVDRRWRIGLAEREEA